MGESFMRPERCQPRSRGARVMRAGLNWLAALTLCSDWVLCGASQAWKGFIDQGYR